MSPLRSVPSEITPDLSITLGVIVDIVKAQNYVIGRLFHLSLCQHNVVVVEDDLNFGELVVFIGTFVHQNLHLASQLSMFQK